MILKFLQWWGRKRPYFDIYAFDGSLYMGRWWLFGGSGPERDDDDSREASGAPERAWTKTKLDAWIGRYVCGRLHHIARPDRERDHHDHPCRFVSIVTKGWYLERLPKHQGQHPSDDQIDFRLVERRAGSIAFRRATDRHTIEQVSPGGAWTIFIMFGSKAVRWGFHLPDGRKVYWKDYFKMQRDACRAAHGQKAA